MGKGLLPGTGRRKPTNRRKNRIPNIFGGSALEWYDWVMSPLLIFLGIMIVLHFDGIMSFFLFLTIRLIDLGLIILMFILLILFVILLFRRRRPW